MSKQKYFRANRLTIEQRNWIAKNINGQNASQHILRSSSKVVMEFIEKFYPKRHQKILTTLAEQSKEVDASHYTQCAFSLYPTLVKTLRDARVNIIGTRWLVENQ